MNMRYAFHASPNRASTWSPPLYSESSPSDYCGVGRNLMRCGTKDSSGSFLSLEAKTLVILNAQVADWMLDHRRHGGIDKLG